MDRAMKNKGLSRRRACDLAGIDLRVSRYRSMRPDDKVIRDRLRELAPERRRFDSDWLHHFSGSIRFVPGSAKLQQGAAGGVSTGPTD